MKYISTEEMIRMFGEEEYIKANEAFAGRKHHFPKNLKLMTDEDRNRMIVEAAQGGVPYNEIAADFDLSESRIYDIINIWLSKKP